MTEYFDKVDQNDNVVGKISREEAHELNLMHRAVHVFIKGQNEVLLQKVCKKRFRSTTFDYQLSGHVDLESYVKRY